MHVNADDWGDVEMKQWSILNQYSIEMPKYRKILVVDRPLWNICNLYIYTTRYTTTKWHWVVKKKELKKI